MIRISTHFILIRHGETNWNKEDRFRGRSDVSLNAIGQEQANQIARQFMNRKIDAVYSSPLPRALETAAPLAALHNLQVEPRAELLDIDYGGWEGLSAEEAQAKNPELWEAWLKAPGRVRFPGGESVRQVRNRIENALHSMSEDHLGETIALFSHRVTCHVILCHVLGLPNDALWRVRQDVACVNMFKERDGHFTVTLMNSIAHLDQAK
ncbi:MAG: histidine phosphatase family protein [Anaerolineae bacterium]